MGDEPTLYEHDVDVYGWVQELHRLLEERGFPSNDPIAVFGAATKQAVIEFQRSNGCDDDGIVGNQTWAALHGETATHGIRNEPYGDTAAGRAWEDARDQAIRDLQALRDRVARDHAPAVAEVLKEVSEVVGRLDSTKPDELEQVRAWLEHDDAIAAADEAPSDVGGLEIRDALLAALGRPSH